MRSTLLTASLVLLAACASDRNPPAAPGDVPENAAPTLRASFEVVPESCADHSVYFVAQPSYSDGSSTEHVRCQYQFADGLIDGCAVTHAVSEQQPVTLLLRDDVSGATASYQDHVVAPATFTATLDVTTSVNMLTWHAHTLYDGNEDGSAVRITISPAANVVVEDPAILTQRDGTVQVTVAGTYTVNVDAEVEIPGEGGCAANASASTNVDCDTGN